jgi:hypothetical protein
VNRDIPYAERGNPPHSLSGKFVMAFDGVNASSQMAKQRCRVAGTSSDFEDPVLWANFGGFHHQRHDKGLADGLILANRERAVLIGDGLIAGIDKGFARYGSEGFEHAGITNAPSGDSVGHAAANGRHIRHSAALRLR